MKALYKRLFFVFIGAGILYLILLNISPKHDLLDSKEVIIIGHRGASAYAPEHTIPSYDLAKEKGADYLELDLQMTKDEELIVMHDNKVDRTTDGKGYVKDYTFSQLKKLDAGSWFNEINPAMANDKYQQTAVPTLKEVIEKYGDSVNYYIEVKSPDTYPGMEKKLLSILKDYGLLGKNQPKDKVVIQSFSEESLRVIHEIKKDIPLIQLQWFENQATISTNEITEIKKYAIGIGINYKSLNEKYIQKLKKHDLLVHAYTVNKKEEIEELKRIGIDGVFTDYIEEAD